MLYSKCLSPLKIKALYSPIMPKYPHAPPSPDFGTTLMTWTVSWHSSSLKEMSPLSGHDTMHSPSKVALHRILQHTGLDSSPITPLVCPYGGHNGDPRE